MKTMTDARTFSTGTYGVEGIPLVDHDGVECLGYSLLEMAKVEEAIALAALEDGCRDPEALRFARKALGYTRDEFATALSLPMFAVAEWERGDRVVDDVTASEIVTLLTQRDRGGFVARRVTV